MCILGELVPGIFLCLTDSDGDASVSGERVFIRVLADKHALKRVSETNNVLMQTQRGKTAQISLDGDQMCACGIPLAFV